MTKKITTIVNFILDKSGSMDSIKDATINGFNEYLNGLKKQKGKILFSLTLFDSVSIDTPYVLTPVKDVAPLNDNTYQPGSMTPLYDAAVTTIEKVAAKVDEMDETPAVLVVVMTDGMENASKEHDEKCLKDLIHKLEHKENYTFVYLGANQDAWGVSQKFGFSQGNVVNWSSTDIGAQNTFRGLSKGTGSYAMAMADSGAKGLSMNVSNYAAMMGGDKVDTSA